MCAAQGLDYRAPLKAGRGAAKAHALVRTLVEPLTVDRALSPDIARIADAVEGGAFDAIASIRVGDAANGDVHTRPGLRTANVQRPTSSV